MSTVPHGDRPDRRPWSTALRHVLPAASRVGNAVRAGLMRVVRRFAQGSWDGAITSSRTKICSARVREDEYRAGFSLPPLPTASTASDFHECPWCLSLGNPGTDGPADPAGP